MRAEPLLSQYRQKPWVSVAKIFEVEDSISRADGELSGPVNLVFHRSTGVKRERSNIQTNWMAFFGGKGTEERGETTWRARGFSFVRCNLKDRKSGPFGRSKWR